MTKVKLRWYEFILAELRTPRGVEQHYEFILAELRTPRGVEQHYESLLVNNYLLS
jgi:hypothetical protein